MWLKNLAINALIPTGVATTATTEGSTIETPCGQRDGYQASVRRTSDTNRMGYVLVHGAGHGAWCWRRVAVRLRAAGHEVFIPTMTGVGERVHLLSPAVGLATMVQDVVAVIESEELTDVVLVGHSFGALVVLVRP